AARVDDRQRPRFDRLEIARELVRGADVPPRAERVRAALGHDVRAPAGVADARGFVGEEPLAIAPLRARDPAQLGAGETIEQDVRGRRWWMRWIVVSQHDHA